MTPFKVVTKTGEVALWSNTFSEAKNALRGCVGGHVEQIDVDGAGGEYGDEYPAVVILQNGAGFGEDVFCVCCGETGAGCVCVVAS